MRILLPVLLISMIIGLPAYGQESEQKPQNLQVLPKDISHDALMEVMDSFTSGLGVRCSHCHAQNPDNERRLDFPSDAKETKKVARVMMQMTQTINRRLLPETGRRNLVQVKCVTCHSGKPIPYTLQQELQTAYQASGLDSAVTRYKKLRGQYYGSAAFDFSEPSLISVAQDFEKSDHNNVAEKFLNINLDYFPKSAATYAQLAQLYHSKGDKDTAMKYFQKALEIEPQNGWIRRQMQQMQNED